MSVVQIKGEQQLQDILKKQGIVLIDFYADWCAPCKKIKPYIKKKAEEKGFCLACVNVDEGENQDLANNFNISSIPQFNICVKTTKNIKKTLMGGSQKVVDQLIEAAIKLKANPDQKV